MNNKALWILLIIFFFIAGAAGSYLLMKYVLPSQQQGFLSEPRTISSENLDLISIRLFLPDNGKLEMIERKMPRRTDGIAMAETVVAEYFKEAENRPPIPGGVKLLGLYRDMKKVLYIDLSDELRRNFQGDALAEYLVLKGIYESLVANVQDFQDVKILVEGKELETLGGHLFLKYPLKQAILSEPGTDGMASGE